MMFSAVGFGLSVVLCCSLAEPMGRLLGVIDYPDGGRKSHAKPTPMVGGIALMVPLLLVALAKTLLGAAPVGIFATLAVLGLGFLILGWYDDRQHAPPSARLVVASGLFGAVVLLQPDLLLSEIDLGPQLGAIPLWSLSFPFTVLCLVGLQNSTNMVDGMNGLLIGLALFWTGCLMLYAPEHLMVYLQFLMIGLLILLPYNLFGVLFLGDAGSYSIGATIGILMIYCPRSGQRRAADADRGAVAAGARARLPAGHGDPPDQRTLAVGPRREPPAPSAGPPLALADLPADLRRAGGRAGRGRGALAEVDARHADAGRGGLPRPALGHAAAADGGRRGGVRPTSDDAGGVSRAGSWRVEMWSIDRLTKA